MEEVKVTRKYQITIPKEARSCLGIEVGDRLLVKAEEGRIVIEVPRKVADPSGFMWSLSEKPRDVDAVRLVEKSWTET